jgi:hypothetical protein
MEEGGRCLMPSRKCQIGRSVDKKDQQAMKRQADGNPRKLQRRIPVHSESSPYIVCCFTFSGFGSAFRPPRQAQNKTAINLRKAKN